MAKAIFQVALEPHFCAGCFKNMEDELLCTNGIVSVKGFVHIGRIRIEYRETEISSHQLEALIANLGYQVQSKKLA